MQFAASERQVWQRSKNSYLTSALTPHNIEFHTPMHTSEMVDEKKIFCFRDFDQWLHTKPSFSQATNVSHAAYSLATVNLVPSSRLDALALSSTSDAAESY